MTRPSDPRQPRTAMFFSCLVPAAIATILVSAGAGMPSPPIWRQDPDPASLVPPGTAQPLLLYFTATWCGPCRLLEREVFAHPAGLAELSHYHLIRLDIDSANGRLVADDQRVQTVPTFVMLAADGQEIERLRGYRSRRRLLRDLARFRQGKGTLVDLQQRLDARPDDHLLRLELGLRHHARQEISMALDLLESGLTTLYQTTRKATPIGSDTTFELASSALPRARHVHPASSEPHGLEPAARDTVVAEAARALAGIYRQLDQPELAARALEDLLEGSPHHPYPRTTWQLLADCRRESGRALAAAEALREAAMIDPPRADLLSDYAAAAIEAGGDLSAAEEAARKAVALTGRSDASIMAVLAKVLRHRRRYAEAMLWIKRAETASPADQRWTEQRQTILRAAIEGN